MPAWEAIIAFLLHERFVTVWYSWVKVVLCQLRLTIELESRFENVTTAAQLPLFSLNRLHVSIMYERECWIFREKYRGGVFLRKSSSLYHKLLCVSVTIFQEFWTPFHHVCSIFFLVIASHLWRIGIRPVSIMLLKCWKVAYWNAKKLLKNGQKSRRSLTKFQKLLPRK